MKITDEELNKRIHYRREFAIRSKRYRELKKEVAEVENIMRKPDYFKTGVVDKRYYRPLAELLIFTGAPAALSTIQVKHGNDWLELGYKELPPELQEFSEIGAVDRKEKTVIIKIHLDRQKDDIIGDVRFLLNRLGKQAKKYNVDLKAKRPQWDVYDKYLKVWDLRKEGKSWRKIASEVLPEEEIDGAMRKVRAYNDQCKKMIEGGLKQI